jgi:tellurite resistance protein TerB
LIRSFLEHVWWQLRSIHGLGVVGWHKWVRYAASQPGSADPEPTGRNITDGPVGQTQATQPGHERPSEDEGIAVQEQGLRGCLDGDVRPYRRHAAGSIDSSERSKVAGLISANDVLSMFPASDLRERFDHYCDRLSSDYDFGKIEAVQSIVKLRSKPDQARAVIQIGLIIGGADGNFDAHERGAISDACFAVGFSASEFDI